MINMENETLSSYDAGAAYLGLGSNLGDRAANLLRALKALRDAGLNLIAISSIYETEPVDYLDQPDFLNMAIADPERRARYRHRSAAVRRRGDRRSS